MIDAVNATVTISGSYRKHLSAILRAREEFIELGISVLRPTSGRVIEDAGNFVRLEGDPEDPRRAADHQLTAIRSSNLLYVVNPGGYIGGSAMFEIGYAIALGLPVVSSEQPFEAAAAARTRAVGAPARAVGLLCARLMLPADLALISHLVSRPSSEGPLLGGAYVANRCETGFALSRPGGDTLVTMNQEGHPELVADDCAARQLIAVIRAQMTDTPSRESLPA